jgi:hypothetical protein
LATQCSQIQWPKPNSFWASLFSIHKPNPIWAPKNPKPN